MNWEDLKDEPTEDLIEYVKCKENADYKKLAEAAFLALTFRFRVRIIDKCRKMAKFWNFDAETADSLAEQTFERFYHNPFKFQAGKCGTLKIDDCVKVYLYAIAQNCFCDYNKEISQTNNSPYDGTEQVIVEFPLLESLDLTKEKAITLHEIQKGILDILTTLTPKHKTIYLTYKAYEKKGFKLPRTLLIQLREQTKLSQSSIRVYKKEVFNKIDEYLKENDAV